MIELVYSPELISKPLLYGIENNLIEHKIDLVQLPETQLFDFLESGKSQIGVISPLVYAKSRGNLFILNDFTISSPRCGRNALLYFQGNLKSIDKIWINRGIEKSYDKFTAQVVLKEMLNIDANWQFFDNSEDILSSLKKFNVLFFSGEKAFDLFKDHENFIDLSEEWIVNTSFPYVHRILVVHRSFDDMDTLNALRLSQNLGTKNLKKIGEKHAQDALQSWDIYFELLNEMYHYFPDELSWASLENILQYAFYYGECDYYPELRFFNLSI
jgi:predicted solute-binding protein